MTVDIWHCLRCCQLAIGSAIAQTSYNLLSNRRGDMAEPLDLAVPADAPVLERLPMRDEAGAIRPEFVEEISRCIKEEQEPFLREVVGELHEADLGDLIGALGAEDRVRLVELTRADFHFSGLNGGGDTVRE